LVAVPRLRPVDARSEFPDFLSSSDSHWLNLELFEVPLPVLSSLPFFVENVDPFASRCAPKRTICHPSLLSLSDSQALLTSGGKTQSGEILGFDQTPFFFPICEFCFLFGGNSEKYASFLFLSRTFRVVRSPTFHLFSFLCVASPGSVVAFKLSFIPPLLTTLPPQPSRMDSTDSLFPTLLTVSDSPISITSRRSGKF